MVESVLETSDFKEDSNISQICAYSKDGVCILSDCRCQVCADGKLRCSSFKPVVERDGE